MQTEEVRIDEILWNPKRYKTHSKEKIRTLEEGIKRFGFTQDVVLSQDDFCIAGHARIQAAINLGWETIPCKRTTLSGEEAITYLIADNRLADLGQYDLDILSEIITDIPKELTELTGFDQSQIDDLIAGNAIEEIDKFISESKFEEIRDEVDADPQIDKATELNLKWQVEPGQLWQLGNHRLICGDCTDVDIVYRMAEDDIIAGMWTDPPYGVNYIGKTKDALTIENDGSQDLPDLLSECFRIADTILKDGAPIYIAHPAGALSLIFGQIFVETGWKFHETIVWLKNSMVLGHSDYHYKHEPIIYGWKGSNRRWYAGRDQVSTLEYDRPQRSEFHPTMKPVGLVVHCLRNSTRKNDLVYEPFCGSGTTLLACENISRRCRAVELSPDYCAVILQRYQDATGITPVLVT